MGKIRHFVVLVFSIYASSLGYALSTLLKTCEGENLQDCVRQAESMLSDPDMTFPDDNKTLQSVCRMWEDMTECTYNYTARCLSRKEDEEFRKYFHKPMTSMNAVCGNGESTKEYLLHAHCIKKISTGENYCGTQYKLLVDQIVSLSMSSMKKICCALADFKDCVVKSNANHVCREGLEDSDIASYALRTLDKSILAFVTHSCKEGFQQQKCLEEDEPNDEPLSPLQEARWDFLPMENESQFHYTTVNEIEPSYTPKPLLVPLSQSLPQHQELDRESGDRDRFDGTQGNIRANITHFGELGKLPTSMENDNINRPGMPSHQIIPIITPANQQNSRIDQNQNYYQTQNNNQRQSNASYPNWMNDLTKNKNRNINSIIKNNDLNNNQTMVNNKNSNNYDSQSNSNNPIAEKRIDLVGSPSIDNTKYIVDSILNNSAIGVNFGNLGGIPNAKVNESMADLSRNSRVNAGRSLNFIDPGAPTDQEKSSVSNFKKVAIENTSPTPRPSPAYPDSLNSTIFKIYVNATFNPNTHNTSSHSMMHNPYGNNNNTSVYNNNRNTSSMNSVSKSPRIINNVPAGNSLATLNQQLGLSPPSTTRSPSRTSGNGNSRTNVRTNVLNFPSTTKSPESKNSGNFSVSDVPIRVFFVWLSTFFV